MNTIECARGRWRDILPRLGVDRKFLQNKHGPCPLCGGKDRFRFDDKHGDGTYFCSQCGAGTGLILIRKLRHWGYATACAEVDKIIGRAPQPAGIVSPARQSEPTAAKERTNRARIERMLADANTPQVVDAFLRTRRLTVSSSALRGHPACPYFDDGKLRGDFPAVVAPILAPDGTLESAALIYSAAAPEPRKKFMPVVNTINGAAVRLHDPVDGHLGVAEGIATALAATQLFGIPTWAALSACGMKAWSPPPGVERVTIFADRDRSNAGQAAAYALAQRLTRDRIVAEVEMPTVIGADFADLLPEPKERP